MKETLALFIAEVLGSCVFGLQCNNFKVSKSDFVRAGHESFKAGTMSGFRRFLTFASPRLIVLLRLTLFPRFTINFFKKIIDEVIDHREKANERRNDMMQVLIDIKADPEYQLKNLPAHAIGFFAAGFETSASAMTLCFYELARRPEIQARIRGEIQECLKKNNGELTYDGLMEMKYLDQALNETLRYYPLSGTLQRRCTEDYILPNGIIFKKGQMILLSLLGIQRDEEFYPNPDYFDPERFSDENKAKRRPSTFIPFGEGPRVCLGMRFAYMQIKVGLVSVLREHEVSPHESLKYPIEFKSNATFLTAKDHVLLKLKKA